MKQLRSRSYGRPLGQRALGAHRSHRTRAYGARRRLEQRGSPTITRYQEVARWSAELAMHGRVSAAVPVEVVDQAGMVVLSAVVEWFIARGGPDSNGGE